LSRPWRRCISSTGARPASTLSASFEVSTSSETLCLCGHIEYQNGISSTCEAKMHHVENLISAGTRQAFADPQRRGYPALFPQRRPQKC
jgi:hypothetical protein